MPRGPYSILLAVIALTIAARFIFFTPGSYGKFALPLQKSSQRTIDEAGVEVLKSLQLTSEFEYSRICIQARPKRGVQRTSVVDILVSFFDTASTVVLTNDELHSRPATTLQPCHARLNVDVPDFDHGAKHDTSALFLGMATTLPRFNASLPALSRWLSNTGSPLQVLVVDQPELDAVTREVNEVRERAKRLGIEVLFDGHPYPSDSEGTKNFGLVQVLQKNKRPETRWFGIIDDDTFFVSLPQMLHALKPFDPEKSWYIGALTEGLSRVAKEGFKAWGGAGFFVSPPLMQILADHSEQCRELDEGFGDLLWRDCIIEHTSPTVPLTTLRGLNQIDMWRDISGWYESNHQPLYTVHHWKSWHFHPVPDAHLVADIAGPDSFLQRYSFQDNAVLTNGFSLSHYPSGLPDLNLTELTMVEDVGKDVYPEKKEFLHTMGMTRPAMELGKTKLQWRFETAFTAEDGSVRQFYVQRSSTGQGRGIDSVVQIDWTGR